MSTEGVSMEKGALSRSCIPVMDEGKFRPAKSLKYNMCRLAETKTMMKNYSWNLASIGQLPP